MDTHENIDPLSAITTVVDGVDQPKVCPYAATTHRKKYALLAIFTLAQFMDVASNSMLFPAVPQLASDLHMTGSQPSWIFAAYSSTFSAFLLISGRAADIYTPKPVFISGNIILGCFALGTGFIRKKIPLLLLRAFSGIGAAFTIPAAFNMIVRLFPDPNEQGLAIAVFGAAGGLANIGGLLIGGVLTQFASWHWIFWVIAIASLSISAVCVVYIPEVHRPLHKQSLDLVGVSTVGVALILFIFAVTQGSNGSWGDSGVVAPLVLSVFVMVLFFIWEWWIDEKNAALPPKMWFYPNFSVLFGIALVPYLWWVSVLFLLTPWWQDKMHYTDVDTAVRFLPIGIPAGFAAPMVSKLLQKTPSKFIATGGLVFCIVGTVLFPFADQRDRYWSLLFPAMVLGTIGAQTLYVTASIAFFQTTPPEVAGIVGAVFNCALQLGGAVGVACVTSIQTSIDRQHPNKLNGYAGRAAAFWFVLGCISLLLIFTLIFYHIVRPSEDIEAFVGGEKARELEFGADTEEPKAVENKEMEKTAQL